MTTNNSAQQTGKASMRPGRRLTRWQAEFPYHWDADDQVSRRELLRFAVMASGALFAATAGVVALNYLKPLQTVRRQAITQVANVPPGGVHYFQYPTSEDHAILLHLTDGRFVAYSGRCTHLSCAVYHDQASGNLLCPCHEGVFDSQTGSPLAGPPQRSLPVIHLQQDGTMLYAIEEGPNV
jgi:arsenite oxidase small subunit